MPKQIIKTSHIKHDEYVAFVADLSLNGLGLDECEMKLDRLALADAKAKNVSLINEISGGQKILSHGDTQFVISADYLFQTKMKTGDTPLTIKCSFSALFATKEKARKEHIDRFADNEARLIFWPYLRHLISDSTYRMAVDAVIIPLTSELAVRENSRKESKSAALKKRPASREAQKQQKNS